MKRSYGEGSVFLVPLRDGGYARGVIARAGPDGKVLFGYFFGPRLASNAEVPFEDLNPATALLHVRFGALGLLRGDWPVLAKLPSWDRSEWPMHDFARRDPLGQRKARLVHYSNDDPSRIEAEFPIDDDAGLATDSLSGYGAVEIKLTKLLG
jgi:hypothetical protein